MSYAKVLLIVVNLIATDEAFILQTHPPNRCEIYKYSRRDALSRLVFLGPKPLKSVFWIVGLGEIGLIVASHFPTHPVLQKLLSLVPRPSGASFIRITRAYVFGTACIVSGGFINRSAYSALGRMFTFHLTILDKHKLVTDGPYAYVRHPACTGSTLHFIGTLFTCFATGSFVTACGIMDTTLGQSTIYLAVLCLTFMWMAVISRVNMEDEVLKKEFRTKWEEWARSVRYKIIPWIF